MAIVEEAGQIKGQHHYVHACRLSGGVMPPLKSPSSLLSARSSLHQVSLLVNDIYDALLVNDMGILVNI